MYYENMPLYPGMRPPVDPCMRIKLFEGGPCPGKPRDLWECGRVTIDNPCCPGERAEVVLGVDACGSLVVCVHREPDDCPPPRRYGRPECRPPVRPCPPEGDACRPPKPPCPPRNECCVPCPPRDDCRPRRMPPRPRPRCAPVDCRGLRWLD